jgi:hypothetical protein
MTEDIDTLKALLEDACEALDNAFKGLGYDVGNADDIEDLAEVLTPGFDDYWCQWRANSEQRAKAARAARLI